MENTVAERNGLDVGFTFRDDGTFDFWHSGVDYFASGNYTYTDTHIIFTNATATRGGIDMGSRPNSTQRYGFAVDSKTEFRLYKDNPYQEYGDGPYVKR
ncbi:MAG: hypothetical protein LBQ94_07755 [Treponema sp.]|jgi:hypothetical protein|nr:hypothetical protein [Treponema sp.]